MTNGWPPPTPHAGSASSTAPSLATAAIWPRAWCRPDEPCPPQDALRRPPPQAADRDRRFRGLPLGPYRHAGPHAPGRDEPALRPRLGAAQPPSPPPLVRLQPP